MSKTRCDSAHSRPTLENRVQRISLIVPLRYAVAGWHLEQCEKLFRYLNLATSSVCGWRRPRLTGSLSQKRQQFSIDLLGRLPLEKVSIRPQMLGPGLREDGPPDVLQRARTHGFSRPHPSGAKQEQERRRQLAVRVRLPLREVFVRRGAVIAEAAAERPRLGVRLDVLRYLLIADRILIHGPIPENMPQIDLLAPFDQLFRQIALLMEVGVPALTDHLRPLWPIALVRWCGV